VQAKNFRPQGSFGLCATRRASRTKSRTSYCKAFHPCDQSRKPRAQGRVTSRARAFASSARPDTLAVPSFLPCASKFLSCARPGGLGARGCGACAQGRELCAPGFSPCVPAPEALPLTLFTLHLHAAASSTPRWEPVSWIEGEAAALNELRPRLPCLRFERCFHSPAPRVPSRYARWTYSGGNG
jgi:hypothetical protein